MLLHLHIRNLAVVRHLDIDFAAGMSAITGETGAGKSIALDALGLCLGDRADVELIRTSADKAEVSASFQLGASASPAIQWLAEQELNEEADADASHISCVIRRVITREGRSKA